MSNSIIQAFKGLNVTNGDDQDHANIYEISYQYLSKVKKYNDIKSFNNCLVALINLDKYNQALELINKVKNDELIQQFSIEVGYVYYKTRQSSKLHKLYEAINSKANESSKFLVRGLKHIMAQDCYQTGKHEMTLELYHDLITSNEQIDNSLDLATNEVATVSQSDIVDTNNVIISKTSESSHDLVLNEALVALKNNQFVQALELLSQALNLLNELNLDEESYQLEKCPLVLVQSYILHLQKKTEESKQLLQELQLNKFNDLLLSLIINNNYYSFDELISDGQIQENINLIHRSLNYQQNIGKLSSKLSFSQYNTLVKNNLLLSYLSATLSKGSKFLTSSTLNPFIERGDYSLLTYKVLIKLGITNDDLINEPTIASKKLFKVIKDSTPTPETFNELAVCGLLLTSLNLYTKNFTQCFIALRKLVDYNLENDSNTRVLPGLVGSLVNLFEMFPNENLIGEDDHSWSTSMLRKLVQRLEKLDLNEIDEVYYNFFKAVGFKLMVVNHEDHIKVFKILNQKNPRDTLVSNVLNNTTDNLIPVEKLVNDVDDEVINTDIESFIKKPISNSGSSKVTANKVTKKATRKPKFGATKVIKPEDQLNLDNERWLPMRLRSYYKPKKSKKKAPTHQGAVESPAASQTPTPSSTPAPSSSSKKNNKKKKKGKK